MSKLADTGGDRLPVVLGAHRSHDEVVLDIFIPDSLFYFQGHFPGYAILPGVVQVDWALQFGREYLLAEAATSQIIQVKFRKPIRPREQLRLRLTHACAQRWLSFNYSATRDQRSTGRITLAPL